MGRFIGSYKLAPITPQPNRYWYEPDAMIPLTYYADDGSMYQLRQCFETDLASVPRFLWSIPGFSTGDWPRPALLHDWLYQQHHNGDEWVDFATANALLAESLRAEGASRLLSWVYQGACDWFGGCIWERE